MKWSIVMAVAKYIGLVSLLLAILTRLGWLMPVAPWNVMPAAFLSFSMTCFLFAILAGLTHIIRTKG